MDGISLRNYRASMNNLLYEQSLDPLDVGFRKIDVALPPSELGWGSTREYTENTPLNKPVRTIRSETHGPLLITRERSNSAAQRKLRIARSPGL